MTKVNKKASDIKAPIAVAPEPMAPAPNVDTTPPAKTTISMNETPELIRYELSSAEAETVAGLLAEINGVQQSLVRFLGHVVRANKLPRNRRYDLSEDAKSIVSLEDSSRAGWAAITS